MQAFCYSMNLDLSIQALSPSRKVDTDRRDHDDCKEQADVDDTVPQGFQGESLEHSLQVFRLVQMRKRVVRHWLSQKRT
jgi:hypothetical protein